MSSGTAQILQQLVQLQYLLLHLHLHLVVVPAFPAKKRIFLHRAHRHRKDVLTKILLSTYSPEELQRATRASYTKAGKRNVATVIKKVVSSSPRSIKAIKDRKLQKPAMRPYTPREALAFVVKV